jgi:hypothetical protein
MAVFYTSAGVKGNGGLNLDGMLSGNFVVQHSTNLAGTNWMNLLSLPNLPASPYLFLDPAGDGEPGRLRSEWGRGKPSAFKSF